MADTVKPSDVAQLTEDQVGQALANIRQVIKDATGRNLTELQRLRRELNKKLDTFVFLALDEIDRDPEIKAVIAELQTLTIMAQKAAKEMQPVTKAIKGATKVLGFADQFLGLIR